MQISVAADEEFRARPDWDKLIRQRIETVSRAWEPQFGIRWSVSTVNPWMSQNGANPEMLRRSLQGGTPGGSAILLGVSGQAHPPEMTGYVAPFTKILLVFDSPQQSESDNTAILSHQLARLFGAWVVSDGNSVMNAHPTTLHFDSRTAEVVGLAKDVDFQKGIVGMDPAVMDRLGKLYMETKGDAQHNPLFQAHARAGEELLALRNIEPALAELRKAAEIDPSNARLRNEIAVALVSINEVPSAIKEFREVVRQMPDSAQAHANLGALLSRSGNTQEGNAELRKAVQLQPQDAALRITLGSSLIRTPGQLDAGIAELREGVRLNPNSSIGKTLLERAQQSRGRTAR